LQFPILHVIFLFKIKNKMHNWFFLVLAVAIGTLMPTQAAINNKLATFTQSTVLAALVSFAVGTLTLLLYCLVGGIPLNQLPFTRNTPTVAWTGGILGAIYVAMVAFLVPRMGVALMFSLIIAGQMLITLFFDHYGILGVPIKAINLPRLMGVLLIIAGVILIRRF
jgi:bacterial/archaeal transporter family-2 protein